MEEIPSTCRLLCRYRNTECNLPEYSTVELAMS